MVYDAVTEPDSLEETDRPRAMVLIVEDDPVQAEPLSWRLERLGFETLVAARGQEGLRLAKSERPAVVLLDLQLPDIDGLEVCERLADDGATCDIPVIILTASEEDDIVRRARAAGCEFFLRKPYDPNVVLTLVERALDRLGGE
jgi:CheY-like chemotaxis protein